MLERASRHWHLLSRFDDAGYVSLGWMPAAQLPDAAPLAGLAILRIVWSLRLPARLQMLEWSGGGVLSHEQVATLRSRLSPGTSGCLVRRLQAEGHTIKRTRGPMGTNEHVLVLGRSRPNAAASGLSFLQPAPACVTPDAI